MSQGLGLLIQNSLKGCEFRGSGIEGLLLGLQIGALGGQGSAQVLKFFLFLIKGLGVLAELGFGGFEGHLIGLKGFEPFLKIGLAGLKLECLIRHFFGFLSEKVLGPFERILLCQQVLLD